MLQDGSEEPFNIRLHLAKDILTIQEQDVICVSGEPFYSSVSSTIHTVNQIDSVLENTRYNKIYDAKFLNTDFTLITFFVLLHDLLLHIINKIKRT